MDRCPGETGPDVTAEEAIARPPWGQINFAGVRVGAIHTFNTRAWHRAATDRGTGLWCVDRQARPARMAEPTRGDKSVLVISGRAMRHSFGSFWAILGVALAGISLFNLTAEMINLDVQDWVLNMLWPYIAFFDWLYWMMQLPAMALGFDTYGVPSVVRDSINIFMLMAGVVSRMVSPAFDYSTHLRYITLFRIRYYNRYHFLVMNVLSWPYTFLSVLRAPFLCGSETPKNTTAIHWWEFGFYRKPKVTKNPGSLTEPQWSVHYDARAIFLFQSTASTALATVFHALNRMV